MGVQISIEDALYLENFGVKKEDERNTKLHESGYRAKKIDFASVTIKYIWNMNSGCMILFSLTVEEKYAVMVLEKHKIWK